MGSLPGSPVPAGYSRYLAGLSKRDGGIEPRSALRKANTLPAVLALQSFFTLKYKIYLV